MIRITHGAIKIIIEDENHNEMVLFNLHKGSTITISFVNCIHRSKSILRGIAIRDSEAIFIPVKKLDEWLVKYETWRHFIIESYHFRMIELVNSYKILAFKKLDDRLTEYLMNKVKLMKTSVLNLTHQEIATDMHTARTIISRLLKDLEKEGKVKLKRNRIVIINL
ncbi:MAG: Crp/Fnr family transcriptional regulator [Gelidibacter sp.]|nr:Crp/Fnr family transcriptional regulator [Gelidibacter sp.]